MTGTKEYVIDISIMLTEYRQFVARIEEGEINHGYILLGENNFLKDKIINLIQSKLIEPKFDSTDRLAIYGEDYEPQVMEWFSALPFGSRKKLLIIRHSDNLPPNAKKAIQQWLLHPSQTAVLILIGEKVEFKNTMSLKCWKLFPGELREWVKSYTREKGFNIEQEAIVFLQQIFDTDLYAWSTELDKIMNFIEPEKVIKLSDVQDIESRELTGSVFDLTHAIGEKELAVAQNVLKLLFELGEKPARILWMIYSHLNKLLELKEHPDESFGISQFYLPRYKKQANLWSTSDLLNAFSNIYETDLSIKTGKGSPQFLLQELVYKLQPQSSQKIEDRG